MNWFQYHINISSNFIAYLLIAICLMAFLGSNPNVVSGAISGSIIDCPLSAMTDRIIVDFKEFNGDTPVLLSSDTSFSTAGPFNTTIPVGDYVITLVSFDFHSVHGGQNQPAESYYLLLKDNSGNTIGQTGTISDIPEADDWRTEIVNNSLNLTTDITSVTAVHAAYPDFSDANSLHPVCVAFDKIPVQVQTPYADLSINKVIDKTSADTGDTLTYTVTVTNHGPDEALTTIVEDVIPSGLTFVSSTATIGTYSTSTGVWSIGNLANSSSTVLTLMVIVNSGTAGQKITNTSTVSNTVSDPNSNNNTSSVDINVNNPTTPPTCTTNCGGGGGGGGSSKPPENPDILPPVTSTSECFYLRDYMRRDFNNDPVEVLKLQAFLLNFEGHSEVSLTGVFDQATFDAVSAFQMKYFDDILAPWGHTGPTGYVYILTLKKINEIYCQHVFPLNQAQINEIAAYRDLLEHLGTGGGDLGPDQVTPPIDQSGFSTTTEPFLPVVGQTCPICQNQGQNYPNLAAAIFATSGNLSDIVKCVYWTLLILVVLYIIGNVLSDVLYKDLPENHRKSFLTKWLTVLIGLVAAIVLAYIFNWWCVILPLIVVLILSLVWTMLYPEHLSIRAFIKSWYLVGSLRLKSMMKGSAPKEVKIPENLPVFPTIPKEASEVTGTAEKVIILPPLIPKK